MSRFSLVLALLLAAVAVAQSPERRPPPTVLFLTDFGLRDDSVALCKGVMWSIEPTLRIVDISHDVEPFSVLDGARFLAGTSTAYPAGSVFVAVIDPGVGSTRRGLVAKAKSGQYFVLPDNGLVTLVERNIGLEEVRVITNRQWFFRPEISSTFHGRDVFSPVAAHIARGEDWREVGDAVDTWVRLEIPEAALTGNAIHGAVLAIEHPYGNLVTNVPAAFLEKLGVASTQRLHVRFGKSRGLQLKFARTFSDVKEGEPLAYVDSRGRLAFAINLGNFARQYRVERLAPLVLTVPVRE